MRCSQMFLESTNTACALLESFLMRSQCFISDRYTTPNALYNFELISAVFASVCSRCAKRSFCVNFS